MTNKAFFFIGRYFVDDELLQIINVSFGDQGVYMCVAKSPVDQDFALALLTVLGKYRKCDETTFISW